MAKMVKVAEVSDLEPGQGKVVEAEGQGIALYNVGGIFHAIHNTCLHRGGPLGEGQLDGTTVTCPWHGWQFDLRTGQSWCEPERVKTKSYSVDVGQGRDLVEGPYVAETVQVSVDEQYLVIEA